MINYIYIFLLIISCSSNIFSNKIKMYAIYTPLYQELMDKWFLPSIKDSYKIIVEHAPQDCPSANFNEKGWNTTMLRKVDLIIRGIKENWNSYFIFSDVDIQFFEKTADYIEKAIQNNDLIIQRDATNGRVNTGFFACRGNDKNLQLWTKIRQMLSENITGPNEQLLLDQYILYSNPFDIEWDYLPLSFYNPGILTSSYWDENDNNFIPNDIILHHANWTVGLENKYKQLDKVKKIVENANKSYKFKNFAKNKKIEDFILGQENLHVNAWKNYYHILPSLIKKYNLKNGVEIGVAFGTHSEKILKETSVSKLYSIDPYRNFNIGYDDMMNFKQDYFDVLYKKVANRLSSFFDRSVLIRLTSEEAVDIFENNSLDFVFLDGNHSYEAVSEDIAIWYEKVRSGGLICGDDYTNDFPGVIKAVNEFFNNKNIKFNQDKDESRFWWTIKP